MRRGTAQKELLAGAESTFANRANVAPTDTEAREAELYEHKGPRRRSMRCRCLEDPVRLSRATGRG
jgi:hypothetical protein